MSEESAAATLEVGDEDGVNVETFLRDYEEWFNNQPDQPSLLKLTFDSEDDLWEISLGDDYPCVLAYSSEIDAEFYGEDTGVFIECSVGPPDPSADFSKILRFCGDEMVLSRVSLRDDELVVEAACPYGQLEFELLDLMIREVAAIGADLKDFLEGKS